MQLERNSRKIALGSRIPKLPRGKNVFVGNKVQNGEVK